MQLLKKLLPTALKEYIKKSLGVNQVFSLERLTDEIANRKLAGMMNSTNNKRFQDQVVMVTGGTGSIGRAICMKFASEGAVVIVCGRSMEKLNTIVDEIEKKLQGKSIACILDVTCHDSINNAFKETLENFKKIDVLINCAGGSARDEHVYTFERDIMKIDEILSINLRGTILCALEASRHMMTQRHGKIINFSSLMGIRGKPGYTEYAAAKAGIIGFTKSLALELGASNICVNCVTPSYVPRENISNQRIDQLLKSNCTNTIGVASDIASSVLFLSSTEADFITGQNIIIDGGRSLGMMGD